MKYKLMAVLPISMGFACALLTGCSMFSGKNHKPAKIIDGFAMSAQPNGQSGSSGLNSNKINSQYGKVKINALQQQSQSFNGESIYQNSHSNSNQNNINNNSNNNIPKGAVKLPKTVHFGFAEYGIDSKAKKIVMKNVNYLLQNPNQSILIAGYTDPRGSQSFNLHLGQRRADAVKNLMLQQGVANHQICTVSYGELKPAATPEQFNGNWHKAYQLDRRAVINYGVSCKKG